MASKTSQNSKTTANTVLILAGMAAAWFAAGSTGMLAHPLRHALTWLALGTAIVAAWPEEKRQFKVWAIAVLCLVLGAVFTASGLPAVNVLAVAVVLAAVAHLNRGQTARLALLGALAAFVLASFRLACLSVPTVWHAADWLGGLLGDVAGWLAGNQLNVGATFGGLDFLVLTAVIYIGWLCNTTPPRRNRAIFAGAAILVGQLLYLIVLANSQTLLAHLPETVAPIEEGANHVGLWTMSNGLQTMIPWNLPLLAMIIQCFIVAVMVNSTVWTPTEKPGSRHSTNKNEDITGPALALDMLLQFGPVLLAIAAAVLGTLSLNTASLAGKTIVAYGRGHQLNWQKPAYDSDADGYYGLLPELVASLGGKFVVKNDLADIDPDSTDVLLMIHPDKDWTGDSLEKVRQYVNDGGSLLIAAAPTDSRDDPYKNVNQALEPASMRVRFDTAFSRAANWEQSYDVFSHPAAIGLTDSRNPFGVQIGSSIEAGRLAAPILTGRWGWSDPGSTAAIDGTATYDAGERLGDLILAAEQPFGRGRIVALADTAPLHDETLAAAYPFVGRLLSYLANRPSSPSELWRQLCTLAAIIGLIALLAARPSVWQIMLTGSTLAVALIWCSTAGYWSARVLPDGRRDALNNIAYIDASHLESFSDEVWAEDGLAGLLRNLMQHDYIPLFAPDLEADRLERCGLLIFIGPGKEFSAAERQRITTFVEQGGTVICLVGAEDTGASASLLADFDLRVPHSPVPPGDESTEPIPFGGGISGLIYNDEPIGIFHAAWPVESIDEPAEQLVYFPKGNYHWPLVLRRSVGGGSFVLVGDTHNAVNYIRSLNETGASNFWRWLISHTVAGQMDWNPRAEIDAEDVIVEQDVDVN